MKRAFWKPAFVLGVLGMTVTAAAAEPTQPSSQTAEAAAFEGISLSSAPPLAKGDFPSAYDQRRQRLRRTRAWGSPYRRAPRVNKEIQENKRTSQALKRRTRKQGRSGT